MKIIKYSICIVFMLYGYTVQSQELLIKPSSIQKKLSDELATFIEQRPAIAAYEWIDINTEILSQDNVSLDFLGEKAIVAQSKLKIRGLENYTWVGKSQDKSITITLCVLDKDIQGIITSGTTLYRIETIKGQYIVTKIQQSMYPKELCVFEEHSISDKIENQSNFEINEGEITNHSATQKIRKSGEDFSCKLRVLVQYTDAAESLSSNIINTITLAVEETNQAFENSELNREIELVYVGKSDFVERTAPNLFVLEDSLIADMELFRGNNDGIADDVHVLREQFNADICVLISDVPLACGYADAIKASPDRAFCFVDWDCATGNFTFGHEIGHLIGCRHDNFNDGNSTPRVYAHGYVDVDNRFRTIMATNDECNAQNLVCDRIQHFSNPNVNHNSLTTGDATIADNARLIDEKFPNAMSYRQPVNNIDIVQVNLNNLEVIGDVVATNNIFNSTTLTVSQNQHLCLRSGNTIELKPGFTVSKGSLLNAFITEISDCGEPDGEPSNVDDDGDADFLILPNSDLEVKLIPNPVFDNAIIHFESLGETVIEISLYDFTGKLLKNFGNTRFHREYDMNLELLHLSAGSYFLQITNQIDNSSQTIKIIKL